MDASIPSGYIPIEFSIDRNTETQQAFVRKLERIAFDLGLTHLLGACPGSFPGYRFGLMLPRMEGVCREHLGAYNGEQDNFDRSGQEAARTHSYGKVPVLIISRGIADRAWNQKQDSMRTLSKDTRKVTAEGSGHYIQVDRPELVSNQVLLFIQKLRLKY